MNRSNTVVVESTDRINIAYKQVWHHRRLLGIRRIELTTVIVMQHKLRMQYLREQAYLFIERNLCMQLTKRNCNMLYAEEFANRLKIFVANANLFRCTLEIRV